MTIAITARAASRNRDYSWMPSGIGSIDLDISFMVGDRWRDIEAGRRAGCRTVLVDGGHSEPVAVAPDFRAPSLKQASDWILEVSASG